MRSGSHRLRLGRARRAQCLNRHRGEVCQGAGSDPFRRSRFTGRRESLVFSGATLCPARRPHGPGTACILPRKACGRVKEYGCVPIIGRELSNLQVSGGRSALFSRGPMGGAIHPRSCGGFVRNIVIVSILSAGVALAISTPCFAQKLGPFPGDTAPAVIAQQLDGSTLDLADLQRPASTVVLHFWGVT